METGMVSRVRCHDTGQILKRSKAKPLKERKKVSGPKPNAFGIGFQVRFRVLGFRVLGFRVFRV